LHVQVPMPWCPSLEQVDFIMKSSSNQSPLNQPWRRLGITKH
jgi:hypothetical protein